MPDRVLVVDDDPDLLRLIEFELAKEGIDIETADTGENALAAIRDRSPATIVLDLGLPDIHGKELLERLGNERPEIPIVVLTAESELGEAVECMRLGATDYVQKPFDRTRLVTSLQNARRQRTLQDSVATLTRELRQTEGFASILGDSPAVRKVVQLLDRAASSDISVLIEGPSGTGKEVAARAIHAESPRRSRPFVAVNCGAIPEHLIESELFGHEKGAFTGATASRAGYFEQAEGGTLFFDEVGELRLDLQVNLLRALQEREIQRIGSTKTRKIDVRVVAATNRDLKEAIREGSFREDLYYRLAVFPVALPSLRERDGDVMLLANAFLERYAARHGRKIDGFASSASEAIRTYGWPGNIRELKNVIERATILEDGPEISLGSLTDDVVCALGEGAWCNETNGTSRPVAAAPTSLPVEPPTSEVAAENESTIASETAAPARLNGENATPDAPVARTPRDVNGADEPILPFEEEERRIIHRALLRSGWNVQKAAEQLKIGRATIYRKIEKFGLREPDTNSTENAN